MEGFSRTPKEERIKVLQSLMPEVFDEGRIDWEKLQAALGEDINFSNERYVLNWAGKSEAFRVMQQPSSATLVPCREESVDFDNTQNVFIEGENMEVLKVLQKSYFGKVKMIYIDPPYNTGNDSFIYPDRFSETKEEYLRRVGDKDEAGYMTHEGMFRRNSKENGQYHSNWLNMMMPRLYLAKSLLREDGVIFISIDDNEVHNLRLLMNEVFGEENFVCEYPRVTKKGGKSSTEIAKNHDYVLMYTRNKDLADLTGVRHTDAGYCKKDEFFEERGYYKANQTLDYDSLGYVKSLDYPIEIDGEVFYAGGNVEEYKKRQSGQYARADWGWRWSKELFEFGYKNGFIEVHKGGARNRIYTKTYQNAKIVKDGSSYKIEFYDRTKPLSTLEFTDNKYSNDNAKKVLDGIMHKGIFEYTKHPNLVYGLANLVNGDDFIVLDFFAGSGTTAHAVMQMNKEDGGHRKFICVQLPEPCDEKSEAYKAGYKTIAEIAKERIRRAGAKIREEVEKEQTAENEKLHFEGEQNNCRMPDLGFKVFKLTESNFKQWREIKGSDKDAWEQQLFDFIDPVADNAVIDNMVYELLLKNGKDLNSAVVLKNGYYTVNGNELIFLLDSASQEIINDVLNEKPNKVIALDRLFEGNDQLKTNTALQMRDAGIEFKTI